MTYKINTIYPAFMGEVNKYGIGAKCTFLRFNGCNMRCYLQTKGILCDTPEALVVGEGYIMTTDEIVERLHSLGNRIVCLTGGEPLLQKPTELLQRLSDEGFYVVVETNGSQNVLPYADMENVSFVVDYKSKSSGEGDSFRSTHTGILGTGDFIKFVVDDLADYNEMKEFVGEHGSSIQAVIAVGLFWGSKIGYQELMDWCTRDKLNVTINMQTHKMAVMYDNYREDVQKLVIPKEL